MSGVVAGGGWSGCRCEGVSVDVEDLYRSLCPLISVYLVCLTFFSLSSQMCCLVCGFVCFQL